MDAVEEQIAQAAGVDVRGDRRDGDERNGGDADAADDRGQRLRKLDAQQALQRREAQAVGGFELRRDRRRASRPRCCAPGSSARRRPARRSPTACRGRRARPEAPAAPDSESCRSRRAPPGADRRSAGCARRTRRAASAIISAIASEPKVSSTCCPVQRRDLQRMAHEIGHGRLAGQQRPRFGEAAALGVDADQRRARCRRPGAASTARRRIVLHDRSAAHDDDRGRRCAALHRRHG